MASSGANFTAAINALVAERDRVFLLKVAADYNLNYDELHAKYLETAEQAIKVPRKYTKKPKTVTIVAEGESHVAAPHAPKPAKEPKAKAEKQKCTACTSKKEPCKFSALKGEVFCKRHLRTSQEEAGAPKEKPSKKAPKAEQPVHTHELTRKPTEPCELCESHGNPLEDEADFEVVAAAPAKAPLSAAERLAALLAESDSESESESDHEMELTEEAFEDE
jgi:hypothetical protein